MLRRMKGTSSAIPVVTLAFELNRSVRSENTNASQLRIATVNENRDNALPEAIQINRRLKDTNNTK